MSAKTKKLFDKYKLSYHFHHLEKAIELCGDIKGKSCFEIGGCLPEEIVIGHLEHFPINRGHIRQRRSSFRTPEA